MSEQKPCPFSGTEIVVSRGNNRHKGGRRSLTCPTCSESLMRIPTTVVEGQRRLVVPVHPPREQS